MTTETDCSVLLCGEPKCQQMKRSGMKPSRENDSSDTKLDILEKYFSYRVPGQHFYNGVMWNSLVPRRRLLELRTFQVKPDDVIVTGYPKSGTTWLEEIVYLIEHDIDIDKSNSVPVYIRVPYLESEIGAMIDDMESPRVYKTHLPYDMLPKQVHENKTRIVHIIRDPHDIAVSYYHFYRSLAQLGHFTGTWEEFLNMFMAGYVCCGDWFEYIKGWQQHKNEVNVFFMKYEEMIEDLRSSVLKIAKFLGRSLDEEQVDAIVKHTNFKSMKQNPSLNLDGVPDIDSSISPFMRKGQVGDWKNYFSSSQLEAFDKLTAKKLGPGMWLN